MADTKLADLNDRTTTAGTDIVYAVSDPSGSAADNKVSLNNLFKRGEVTTSSPVIDAAQTWNAGAVTFTGLKFNATDTASAAASLLMDLQVGGSSLFRVGKAGNTNILANGTAASPVYGMGVGASGNTGLWTRASTSILGISINGADAGVEIGIGTYVLRNTGIVQWNAGALAGSSADLFLTRRGAANLRLGAADAASPFAQTLSVQSVVAGTSNTAGANLTITGSQGTGTGAGGSIIFQVAPAGSSGTAQNALSTAWTINSASQLIAGSTGTAAAPSLVLSSTDTGFFSAANGVVGFCAGSFESFRLEGTLGIGLRSAGLLWWASGSTGAYSSRDTVLARDAANTLALRNAANAQAFRVYNTFTSATDFERANIFWDSNVLKIGTEKGSAGGTARALEFQTDGTTRLTIAATGTVTVPNTVGLAISATGGNGFSTVGGGYIIFKSSGVLALSNSSDNGFDRLQFGGTTSSFPALKRSSATLQVRLADDSAYAKIEALNLTNGRTIQKFTPLDNQPPATNFATLDTRNSVATLDFDDGATNEEAVFVGVIPEGAILTSGIKVRIFWAATSATSGACRWGAQFEKYGTDIDSDSFDTATEGQSTTSGTSGIVNVTELTCTTIDSLTAGDQFRIKIYRDSSDTTNDTMTGDAELIAVELQQVA